MNDIFIITCVVAAVFVSMADERKGMYLSLMAGFFQDPLRKITPGEPVYFTVLVGVLTVATFIGAKLRGRRYDFRHIHAWDPLLRKPLMFFIVLVLLQSVAAFLKTSSILLAGIGLLAYLSPIPALLIAYYFVFDKRSVITFIILYLVFSAVMLFGVYLSFMGYRWRLLDTVGIPLMIYGSWGVKALPAGFFRAPEIAAWHGGASVCLLIIVAFITPGQRMKWLAGFFTMFYVGAVLLTGRRKMLMEITLFIPLYWFLLYYFHRGVAKVAFLLLVLALGGALYVQYNYLPDATAVSLKPYLQRGMSVEKDVKSRFLNSTIGSFQWVIGRNGFFGSGAGTGSQGAQHFGGGYVLVGGAAEGGLGKVLAELGVPGLALFFLLLIALARYLWRIMAYVKDSDPVQAKLVYGLMAFLVANAAVFTTAHQAYGDLFILSMLGWLLGFVLAAPRMMQRKSQNRTVRTGW